MLDEDRAGKSAGNAGAEPLQRLDAPCRSADQDDDISRWHGKLLWQNVTIGVSKGCMGLETIDAAIVDHVRCEIRQGKPMTVSDAAPDDNTHLKLLDENEQLRTALESALEENAEMT
jgi:hypothetical protein